MSDQNDTRPGPATVSYHRAGAGEPILLVHGLGSHRHAFDPIIDDLAETRDVIAVDLPGFGETPLPAGFAPSVAAYTDWVAGWLKTLDIERPHVAGNSMGGAIALELGRAGAASKVTAFSPAGFWATPGRIWAQNLVTAIREGGRAGGDSLSRALGFAPVRAVAAAPFFGHPARLSPGAVRADLAAMVAAPAFEAARDSFTGYAIAEAGTLADIPVTVAWGTRDVLLTHTTQSRRARQVLPTATHIDLLGCGHVPFADDPACCLDAIRKTR